MKSRTERMVRFLCSIAYDLERPFRRMSQLDKDKVDANLCPKRMSFGMLDLLMKPPSSSIILHDSPT